MKWSWRQPRFAEGDLVFVPHAVRASREAIYQARNVLNQEIGVRYTAYVEIAPWTPIAVLPSPDATHDCFSAYRVLVGDRVLHVVRQDLEA